MTDASPERILAFVPQWEDQCCGDPLEVGTTRDVTITPHADDWVFDAPSGQPVRFTVEHHVVDVEPRHVRAGIARIWEARYRYVLQDGAHRPAAGTDEIAPIAHLEVWDEARVPARHGGRWAGWSTSPSSTTCPTGITSTARMLDQDETAAGARFIRAPAIREATAATS